MFNSFPFLEKVEKVMDEIKRQPISRRRRRRRRRPARPDKVETTTAATAAQILAGQAATFRPTRTKSEEKPYLFPAGRAVSERNRTEKCFA